MMKGENGSTTLYVTYEGDAYNEAIDDALSVYGLRHGQVSVIAIPTASKLLKNMKGRK